MDALFAGKHQNHPTHRLYRHPYNQNEYFADIIFNYSIKDATEEKYIKKINSIIRTETDEGDDRLTIDQRFEMVLKNHLENRDKYAYKTRSGKRIVKPITIFICPTQKNAQKRSEEFIAFLTRYKKKHQGMQGTDSENVQHRILNKVFCQFINRQSKAILSFDVRRWMFDVRRSKKFTYIL